MWYEIHWFSAFERYALYVGTDHGYVIGKLYGSKVSARLSAFVHNYKFFDKKNRRTNK